MFAAKKQVVELLDRLVDAGILASNGDRWWPACTYYLSHGEYSQPDYRPARYRDGWGISVEHYYYPGTYGAPSSGRHRADIEDLARRQADATAPTSRPWLANCAITKR